ncbi:hypothetical protein ACIPEL_36490 [Streptomyces griseoviridis]
MPTRYSAVYHRDLAGRIPPGDLVYVEDHEGAWSDIYLHPDHAKSELVHDFNWVTRHQIGSGLWQQNWTHDGRMQEPAEGLGVAISGWEIVPHRRMPSSRSVVPIDQDGSCMWIIREGACSDELCAAMNAMLRRIAGDGLWLQYWYPRGGGLRVGAGPVPSGVPALV